MFRSLARPLLLALLAACLFFCGCTLFSLPAQAPASTPTGASASQTSLSTPSPTPRMGNPVWIFYQDFYDVVQTPLERLHGALETSPSQTVSVAHISGCIEGELLLSALESHITEGMMTLGLLLRSDSSSDTDPYASYASSVEGAFQGTGSIQYSSGIAMLDFRHTDGVQLTGTLSPYRLRYTHILADSDSIAHQVLLLRSPQGWMVRLEESNGNILVLRWDGETIGLYDLTGSVQTSQNNGLITFHNAADGYVRCWEYDGSALHMEHGSPGLDHLPDSVYTNP